MAMSLEVPEQAISAKKGRSPLYPRRPATEYALLGLLVAGPGHGYELTRQFSASSELGKICRLEMSMLYSLLKKLEREGLLSGRDEAVGEHKSRRVVELTEAGRAEFEAWLIDPVRTPRDMRLSFLVKLYFARKRSSELVLRLLEEQLEFNQALLTKLQARQQAIMPMPENQFEEWVINFRLEQTSATLRWLAHCRSQLETNQSQL